MTDEPSSADSPGETHFGFRTVPEAEKAGMVHGVFSSVASRYDLMNDLMSCGVHRLWQEAMIDWLAPRPGMRLLAVARGTGDISVRCPQELKAAGHATHLAPRRAKTPSQLPDFTR